MNRKKRTSLNDLNLSLQGRDSDLLKNEDKIRVFMKTYRNYFIPGEFWWECHSSQSQKYNL